MKDRHSTRIFSDKDVEEMKIALIRWAATECPSSCNRQAILLRSIRDRDHKQLLGGLLVGGVGWVHRAKVILLIFADNEAYKENIPYMAYLDAGVVVQQTYLMCTALGLKCCFVNPNIREKQQKYFNDAFKIEGLTFCGAIAIGYGE